MTYWATLWYAGAVVLQLGGNNMSLPECNALSKLMLDDIQASYQDKSKIFKLEKSMFPTNKFTVTCETEMLPIDEKYAE